MCSVRHRPIPSAPKRWARRASSGVSALARTPSAAQLVAPAQDGLEAFIDVCLDERYVVGGDRARAAVDRDQVAARSTQLADPQLAGVEVDVQLGRAGDRRAAHAPRDQRRMRRLAALGGEDSLGGVEAGDVVGLGERPHEDHVGAVGASTASSAVNTIAPLAAPGDAATPRASTV